MNEKKKFGEFLIEKRIISTSQLEEAIKKQKDFGLQLGDTLLKLKFVSENVLLESLSQYLGLDYLNIAENDFKIIDKSLSRVLPLEVCQKYKILPIFRIIDDDTNEITLAMSNPFVEDAIKEAVAITESKIIPVLANSAAIEEGILRMYSIKADIKTERLTVEKGDPVSLVDKTMKNAISLGVSDVHFEPHAKEVHIRMRIDGVMEVVSVYPSQYHNSVVSRIKIMASEHTSLMKIEEKRLPQDGAFSRKIEGHTVDCRVSTLPTIFGEKVVIRVFDKDKVTYIGRIRDLKLSPRMEVKFRRCVRKPAGINVVTGPTGCGKTTTLNAVINEINSTGTNIITIEDPVEYEAPDYVNQSSLMPQVGYTYARALRAIMRQDPDIILIGEIRDLETAEVAVQAALTGHRVFTTLHTENAAGSIARLIDIGVEHFLVSSTVTSALNQRLIRKVCTNCAEEYVPTMVEMLDIGIDKEIARDILEKSQIFSMRRGRGCSNCRKTGYYGRHGVYELIIVTPLIREMIHLRKGSDEIINAAREADNVNMIFEEGLRLFLTGVTTLGELQNISRGDYKLKSPTDILNDAEIQ